MTLYTFRGYKARAEHRFTCPVCMKPNRLRTFTVEHTVNPFNTNEDGSVKTASEVQASASRAAKLERDQFATAPMCATCENALPYPSLKALREQRRDLREAGEQQMEMAE
jgi:hypothetical protein